MLRLLLVAFVFPNTPSWSGTVAVVCLSKRARVRVRLVAAGLQFPSFSGSPAAPECPARARPPASSSGAGGLLSLPKRLHSKQTPFCAWFRKKPRRLQTRAQSGALHICVILHRLFEFSRNKLPAPKVRFRTRRVPRSILSLKKLRSRILRRASRWAYWFVPSVKLYVSCKGNGRRLHAPRASEVSAECLVVPSVSRKAKATPECAV